MNDLNTVILEGNLTRDPSVTVFNEESIVCKFTIATNRYVKKMNSPEFRQTTAYFLIEAWGAVAKSCVDRLAKGRGIRMVGKLRQAVWTENGVPREKIYVVADYVEVKHRAKKTEPLVEDTDEPNTAEENISNSEELSTTLDTEAANTKPVEIPKNQDDFINSDGPDSTENPEE